MAGTLGVTAADGPGTSPPPPAPAAGPPPPPAAARLNALTAAAAAAPPTVAAPSGPSALEQLRAQIAQASATVAASSATLATFEALRSPRDGAPDSAAPAAQAPAAPPPPPARKPSLLPAWLLESRARLSESQATLESTQAGLSSLSKSLKSFDTAVKDRAAEHAAGAAADRLASRASALRRRTWASVLHDVPSDVLAILVQMLGVRDALALEASDRRCLLRLADHSVWQPCAAQQFALSEQSIAALVVSRAPAASGAFRGGGHARSAGGGAAAGGLAMMSTARRSPPRGTSRASSSAMRDDTPAATSAAGGADLTAVQWRAECVEHEAALHAAVGSLEYIRRVGVRNATSGPGARAKLRDALVGILHVTHNAADLRSRERLVQSRVADALLALLKDESHMLQELSAAALANVMADGDPMWAAAIDRLAGTRQLRGLITSPDALVQNMAAKQSCRALCNLLLPWCSIRSSPHSTGYELPSLRWRGTHRRLEHVVRTALAKVEAADVDGQRSKARAAAAALNKGARARSGTDAGAASSASEKSPDAATTGGVPLTPTPLAPPVHWLDEWQSMVGVWQDWVLFACFPRGRPKPRVALQLQMAADGTLRGRGINQTGSFVINGLYSFPEEGKSGSSEKQATFAFALRYVAAGDIVFGDLDGIGSGSGSGEADCAAGTGDVGAGADAARSRSASRSSSVVKSTSTDGADGADAAPSAFESAARPDVRASAGAGAGSSAGVAVTVPEASTRGEPSSSAQALWRKGSHISHLAHGERVMDGLWGMWEVSQSNWAHAHELSGHAGVFRMQLAAHVGDAPPDDPRDVADAADDGSGSGSGSDSDSSATRDAMAASLLDLSPAP